ncbi:MAG: RNA polymerase sigma factor [Lachnospira sp.]
MIFREQDKELIRLIVENRDTDSANQLIHKYYKYVYKEIFIKVQDEELTMDLTQETFIAILKGLKGFDSDKASFRTWIKKIAENKVIDYFRSRQYHEQLLTEIMGESAGETVEIMEQKVVSVNSNNNFYSNLISMDDKVISDISADEIRQKLSSENEEDRKIFLMKAEEGYTFEEISDILKLSRTTVKNKYYALVKRFRKEVGDIEED